MKERSEDLEFIELDESNGSKGDLFTVRNGLYSLACAHATLKIVYEAILYSAKQHLSIK
jgi:hypothetical protein